MPVAEAAGCIGFRVALHLEECVSGIPFAAPERNRTAAVLVEQYADSIGIAKAVTLHINGSLARGENENVIWRVEGHVPEAVVKARICVVYITAFSDGAVAQNKAVFLISEGGHSGVFILAGCLIGFQPAMPENSRSPSRRTPRPASVDKAAQLCATTMLSW